VSDTTIPSATIQAYRQTEYRVGGQHSSNDWSGEENCMVLGMDRSTVKALAIHHGHFGRNDLDLPWERMATDAGAVAGKGGMT